MKRSISAFILALSSFYLVSCSKVISIIGVAKDGKNIATVVTENRQYFLRGVHHWDTNYLDKKVKVTGTLFFVKYVSDSVNGPNYTQSYNADMYYILKAKWKLVK